ncbi:MAG: hypothetical protein JEZ03_16830 [Bacteroidales bacterium]|nr:hypothetical protein [Bacteroidales bacterium]
MPAEDSKICPFCAETIKKDAVVCRFCGRDLQQPVEATTPEPIAVKTQGSQKKPKNKKTRNTLIIIISVLVFICCLAGLIGASKDNEKVSTVDIGSANSTKTTPPSTPKPEPTMTSTVVLAPSMQEIVDTTKGMTDAQREHYFDTLRGNHVVLWQGKVKEVDEGELFGGYTVLIEMTSSNLGYDVSFPVTEEVALSLNLEQEITFSGTIDYASDLLGLSVRLEDVTIE